MIDISQQLCLHHVIHVHIKKKKRKKQPLVEFNVLEQVGSAALSKRNLAGLIPTIGIFTPTAHVKRQSLPVWLPTINKNR